MGPCILGRPYHFIWLFVRLVCDAFTVAGLCVWNNVPDVICRSLLFSEKLLLYSVLFLNIVFITFRLRIVRCDIVNCPCSDFLFTAL